MSFFFKCQFSNDLIQAEFQMQYPNRNSKFEMPYATIFTTKLQPEDEIRKLQITKNQTKKYQNKAQAPNLFFFLLPFYGEG